MASLIFAIFSRSESPWLRSCAIVGEDLKLCAPISKSRELTLISERAFDESGKDISWRLTEHGPVTLCQHRCLPRHRHDSHHAQHMIVMTTEEEVLDLYDMVVLLNYERNATEPRLRHTKLREVAFPGAKLTTVTLKNPIDQGWNQNACTWIVLDQRQPSNPNAPNLPTQYLPSGLNSTMSSERLETIFHQARNHDGSYQAVGLSRFSSACFPRIRN
jgi:hypothetical protein